ncbi:TetR/AcrR family transcriptional regulator [Pseudoalteromonas shioyasakiensis]|uniref:TetR/AcrR family transcriptional regulator n=1 Tax=Pseudoalteromonas shioyasakiensis TaxID=1190813 RepID=UPI002119B2BE|nr:TetR/AcrR family transcriptional regulator [Pseudoalteromonas shioyasakiensis]MCQ8878723.1 TetR/AcrR family transcriptional regulator [Pseudoalteromonas shioyasakiensis]
MVNKVKFERDEVIRTAGQLFWQKGFNATSTRDLQNAINMRPGSIYAAFGSKEGLYCEAIKDYALFMQNQLLSALNEHESILDGLTAFVKKVLIEDAECAPSMLCMLVKANNEFTEDEPTLKLLSNDLANQFEAFLTTLFEKAQHTKELGTKLTAVEYARYFQIQFTGLRSYLNRPNTQALADALIDQMFLSIKQL